jgi:hypothetical protein
MPSSAVPEPKYSQKFDQTHMTIDHIDREVYRFDHESCAGFTYSSIAALGRTGRSWMTPTDS